MAKHRRMLGCSSDAMSVASSARASSWKCASRRLTATGRPTRPRTPPCRTSRSRAPPVRFPGARRASRRERTDATRFVSREVRRGSRVRLHACAKTSLLSPPKGGPPRERRPRLRGCLASSPARPASSCRRQRQSPPRRSPRRSPRPAPRKRPRARLGVWGTAARRLPRAATTIAAPTPRPAAAESATVAAAVKARPRRPSCSSPKSTNVSPSVRKLGVYPHSAPSRTAGRVASAAGEPLRHARQSSSAPRRHRDRRPRLAETRAQQSDQPSVLVTLERTLVRRRFSALADRREARAGERVQTAGVRADENLRPAAVAPPRDRPRAESLKRGKRRRRERPGPSRFLVPGHAVLSGTR